MAFVGDSLSEARSWLAARLRAGERVDCPCCERGAHIDRRSLYGTQVRALAKLAQHTVPGGDYAHWPTILQRKQADETKLRWWNFVEGERAVRADGSGRNGFWRITDTGIAWLQGDLRVPQIKIVFDNAVLGDDSRRMVTAFDVYRDQFDYRSL